MIENVHIFGATTATGEYLKEKIKYFFPGIKIFTYSRNNSNTNHIDLNNVDAKVINYKKDYVIINVSPIWLLSKFLENSVVNNTIKSNLKGIITCSSSSVITKRFSSNKFDKSLVRKLKISEEKVLKICTSNNIKYSIVRPTLIYGNSQNHNDKNIKFIIQLLSFTPFILLPRDTGIRQPIHAKQLSEALLKILINICDDKNYKSEIISLGGDQELNYKDMIIKLLEKLPYKHPARKTIIFEIPNRLFFFLFSPLLIFKPKLYEAILRIGSDLSGFKKSFQFSCSEYQAFPVLPYFKNKKNF
jgi:hypothetical protein